MPEPEQDRGLISQIGPIEIDWPRTVGYYGGIALAVAFELLEPPLALFIGAIPFFKMLNRPKAAQPTRVVAQLMEGAAKPVGGDAESTIRVRAQTKRQETQESKQTGKIPLEHPA